MVDRLTTFNMDPYSSRMSPSTCVSTLTIFWLTELVDREVSYDYHYQYGPVNHPFVNLVNLCQLMRGQVYIIIIYIKIYPCQPIVVDIPPYISIGVFTPCSPTTSFRDPAPEGM